MQTKIPMKHSLKVDYNIDKLSLIYETPAEFIQMLDYEPSVFDFMSKTTISTVFICEKDYSRFQRTVPSYTLSYMEGEKKTKIGIIKNEFVDKITLQVDNRFLYGNCMHLLYQFEKVYELKMVRIKYLDVCCDANQNLPRKLNTKMHSSDCEVYRRGQKKNLTAKGNQKLGQKVIDNLKTLTREEHPCVSYYFELTPSSCKKSILLRCYDKTNEVETSSHKTYQLDNFDSDHRVYRMEVTTYWHSITKQSKRKHGWSHQYIYLHLTDKSFLKQYFIYFLNRFFSLKVNGKRLSLSEFLCLS